MKTVDFSETIAASDLKVSKSRHLIECMKICDNWQKVVYIKKFKLNIPRNYCADLNQTFYESFLVQGNENMLT